jgi:integrative and conjugative element protein (TIGR02256 family)
MIDSEITYTDHNDNLVVIMSDVVSLLEAYRQLLPISPESAGVLIGERRGKHIVITDISVPGKGDVFSRYQVDRKGTHHQNKVDECFNNSNGTKHYLGEWHTHPEKRPTPSYLDYKSWSQIDKKSESVVFIIVGQESVWLAIRERSIFNFLTEVTQVI